MLEQLLPFFSASIILTLSPGPDIIYVLVQGITNGKKYGVVTALGLVTGILIHTTLVAFGVSVLIKESEIVFFIIKLFGALYLFYLAGKVYKRKSKISLFSEGVIRKPLLAIFREGFIMNVLNPKVTIFFLAFFPGFLWDPEGNTLFQFYVLGLIFMIQAFIVFTIVAIMSGKISTFLYSHRYSGVVLKWLQITVFVGIGIFILL